VLASVVPALIYARVILAFDRYEPEPRRAALLAFLWGGGGAVIFSVIAELAFAAGLLESYSADSSQALSVVVGAPVIEEAFKGLALLAMLWFVRHELDGPVDGLVYGALIGLGFSVVENIGYLLIAYDEDGAGGFGQLVIARVLVNGLGHAAYTGVTGAAVGYARAQYSRGWKRYAWPVAGYCGAVLLHMAWNLGTGLIGYALGEDVSLTQVIAVAGLLLALPTVLLFVAIARRAARKELQVMRRQLADEVRCGVLLPDEYQQLTTGVSWSDRFWSRRRETDPHRRFALMAGELAFRKEHLSRGEPPTAGELDRLNYYRAQLAYLRQLTNRPANAAT
jgi:RsiW-degrading membrane proteinase PrsW (M82 family)